MREVLSVQVDVSDVRPSPLLHASCARMNSMDVGRREGGRGVIDTAARHTVAGRAWDRAYRQICVERGMWERRPVEVRRSCDSSGCAHRSPSFVVLQRC